MRYSPYFLFCFVLFLFACNETETPTETKGDQPTEYERKPGEQPAGAGDFQNQVSQFFFHLSAGNKSSLVNSIHPDLGCYIIAPTPGMYPDYIHVKSMEALEKSAALQHSFLSPWNELVSILKEKKATYFSILPLESSKGENVDICNFSKEGIFIQEGISYTGLSEILKTIQDVGITEEIQENERVAISDFEKKVKRQVITGIKGTSEVYAEGFYFSEIDGKWYLSVIDLSDCAL